MICGLAERLPTIQEGILESSLVLSKVFILWKLEVGKHPDHRSPPMDLILN
jgi:hypothetical protein